MSAGKAPAHSAPAPHYSQQNAVEDLVELNVSYSFGSSAISSMPISKAPCAVRKETTSLSRCTCDGFRCSLFLGFMQALSLATLGMQRLACCLGKGFQSVQRGTGGQHLATWPGLCHQLQMMHAYILTGCSCKTSPCPDCLTHCRAVFRQQGREA